LYFRIPFATIVISRGEFIAFFAKEAALSQNCVHSGSEAFRGLIGSVNGGQMDTIRIWNRVITVFGLALLARSGPSLEIPSATTLYVDPVYSYQMEVPDGWYLSPTPKNSVYGAMVLFNYDPESSDTSGNLPPGAVKMQIGVAPLPTGQSIEDWRVKWINFQTNYEPFKDLAMGFGISEVFVVGELTGLKYAVNGPYQSPSLEILLTDGNQLFVIGIAPSSSSTVTEALKILSGLRPSKSPSFPEEAIRISENWAQLPFPTLVRESTRVELDAIVAGTCIEGTFPGTEAPNSPLSLYMPFRSGETWKVGGSGSFYGNGYHCNSNNDYYATDWNRSNDDGAVVLPIANGTITNSKIPTCPTTGLGCFVQIDHASGIRSVYAHLSSVRRTSGPVSHVNPIGTVGSTGNSEFPHLHLRFLQKHGAYHSHCYNNGSPCPNGEASLSPQSAKPSPINTLNGRKTLVDGQSYTSNNGQGNSGKLDPSFDSDGMLTTVVRPGHNEYITGVAVHTNGKIIAAGSSSFGTTIDDFAVVRYNPNGSLDATFSGDGKLITDFGGVDTASDVVLQPDGKILVSGSVCKDVGDRVLCDVALARYNGNGTLDTTFSGDGKQNIDFSAENNASWGGLAIQPDGKIVIAGMMWNGTNEDLAVYRLNANGTLDTSFSADGKVNIGFGPSRYDTASDLALQSDGKIIVAGNTFDANSIHDFAIARLHVNGSLDTTFSGDGRQITNMGGEDFADGLALQSNGQIVVVGQMVSPNGGSSFALARYNTNGNLDTGFNGTGRKIIGMGAIASAHDVIVQANGKIVVLGRGYDGTTINFALVRINPSGVLDTTFSGDGKVTIGFWGYGASGSVLAVDGKGKYVLGGSARDDTQIISAFAVARVLP
jgi:uncharacterized delta-60 repeat protein